MEDEINENASSLALLSKCAVESIDSGFNMINTTTTSCDSANGETLPIVICDGKVETIDSCTGEIVSDTVQCSENSIEGLSFEPNNLDDSNSQIKLEVKEEIITNDNEALGRGVRNRKPKKKYEKVQRFSRMYTCVQCPQTFSRLSQLRSHSKLHLDDQFEVKHYIFYSCLDYSCNSYRKLV